MGGMMSTAIGAHVLYCFVEDWRSHGDSFWKNGYVSFSEWVDDADSDIFGINDEQILYYFPDGQAELDDYINKQWNDEDGRSMVDIIFHEDYQLANR